MPAAFAVQLVQRLRDQDPKVTPALQWLDERLAVQGTTADEVVREIHQGQGAMNVTVRNVITSMRLMSAVDWAEFFESVSAVDAVLRANSDFAAMDFATRDRYRHAIEKLARGSRHTEIEVAQLAIAAAKGAAAEAPDDGVKARREHHPGYYLISEGRHALEQQLGFRAPVRDWIARANTAAESADISAPSRWSARSSWPPACVAVDQRLDGWTRVVLALLAIIPAMDAAVAIVNRAVTSRHRPRHDSRARASRWRAGESAHDCRDADFVEPRAPRSKSKSSAWRVHYLASPDGELYFALLSDWTDSATETAPGDDELLGAAAAANRAPEPAPRSRPGWREISPAPSPAGVG